MVSFTHILTLASVAVSAVFAAPAIDAREIKARNDFTNTVLNVHNELRGKHYDTPALKWSDELALAAVRWTDGCQVPLSHSGLHPENAYGYTYQSHTRKAIQDWYNEQSMYNYADPTYSDATGHFTQVVWGNATRVGCAWSRNQCEDGMYHFFCDYDAGNMLGEFEYNVHKCKET